MLIYLIHDSVEGKFLVGNNASTLLVFHDREAAVREVQYLNHQSPAATFGSRYTIETKEI